MQFFERCLAARKRAKLSQEALALELNVSRGAVAQWEMREGTRPSIENMAALARRTGVAFEWLATGRGSMIFGEPLAVAEEPVGYANGRDASETMLLARFRELTHVKRSALLELLKPGR